MCSNPSEGGEVLVWALFGLTGWFLTACALIVVMKAICLAGEREEQFVRAWKAKSDGAIEDTRLRMQNLPQ